MAAMKRLLLSRERYIELMKEMAALTLPKCAECKPRAYSCCDKAYCQVAIDTAREDWHTELPVQTHDPELPLMGPEGCTAPPHMRPMCTLHTCQINSMGFTQDRKWDKAYFKLRNAINEEHAKAFPSRLV